MQDRADGGVLARIGVVQFLQHTPHLTGPAARTDVTTQFLVECRQAHRITLFDVEIRKRRREVLGITQF